MRAAKFLNMLHIYRTFDLPYQSQIVPLAAILADIGESWEHHSNRSKLVQWYWNGVFGELYGSAVETRIARFHGSPALVEWRAGTVHGWRNSIPSRPPEDYADAAFRCVQGPPCAAYERRR
ncbi:MAG: hypothetical protein JO108_02860 [Acidobacteriaceae bacterium]|nr:hypothetical protein [Acidobacteriaceae bacterium]